MKQETSVSASLRLTPFRSPRTFSRVSGSHHSANTRVNVYWSSLSCTLLIQISKFRSCVCILPDLTSFAEMRDHSQSCRKRDFGEWFYFGNAFLQRITKVRSAKSRHFCCYSVDPYTKTKLLLSGAHEYEPLSPLISWVNPFLSRTLFLLSELRGSTDNVRGPLVFSALFLIGNLTVFAQGSLETRSKNTSTPSPSLGGNFVSRIGREDTGNEFAISLTLLSRVVSCP